MIPSRKIIETAIADACREIAPTGAAFAIGSYSKVPVAVEEFDFVVILPEANSAEFPTLAKRLTENFVVRTTGDVAVRLASHFVPRSYAHDLTLHGAFYTDRDLVQRRPRILSVLNDDTRIFGEQSLVPQDVSTRIPFLDLVFGRWGLVHALKILHAGGWAVPTWNCCHDTPVIEEREYRLSDPFVLVEFIWYFASKLTANTMSDIERCRSTCSSSSVQQALERITPAILASRRRGAIGEDAVLMMRLWDDWCEAFQELIEVAIAEDRSRLHASSLVNSGSSVRLGDESPK